MPNCQNCESFVTADYVRVFAPEGHENPRVCPQCKDKIRNPDGTIRGARSTRRSDRGDEPAQYDASRDDEQTAATDGGQEVDR